MARASAPELLPVFRSAVQGELLAYVLLAPDAERSAGEIAAAVGAPLATVSRELARLVRAGVLRERRLGRARLIPVSQDSPLVPPLTELTVHLFGPRLVVEQEFADVAGVEELFIFGSWAARYSGVPGRPPADVDVLVVGRPDRAAMYEAAQRCEARLGIPVNTTVRSVEKWRTDPDSFAVQVQEGPLVRVGGAS